MVKFVDEILIKLGVDPSKLKEGFAEAVKASKSFSDKIEEHEKGLQKLTLGGAVAFAAQAAFIKDVTGEFAAQETAVNKLEVLLKQDQRTRQDSVKILTDQADALQKITPFADEQIISMQATAAAFKLTDQQIEQLTPHLLDAAAGFRDVEGNSLDLNTVMLSVGKALEGNQQALAKMGISVDLTGDKSKDLAIIIQALEERFGGAAVAAGETFAGKMKIAANQIGEVKEQLGAALAPTIVEFTDKLLPLIQKMGQWAGAHKDIVLAIVGGGIAGAGLISALSSLGLLIAAFGAAGGPIAIGIVAISALVGWILKLKLASDQKLGDLGIDELNAKVQKAQEELQKLIEYREKLAEQKPGLNNQQVVSIFQFGSVDKALDEADKRIAQSKAYIDELYASLSKTPKLELETRLEDANKELSETQKKIDDIKSGGTSIQSIGVLDGLEKQARDTKALIDALKRAIESIPEIQGPSIPDAVAQQRTPNAEEDRARRLALSNTVADDKKATQAWLDARLQLLQEEFAKEKQEAEENGKDTVAIEVKFHKQSQQAASEHFAALRALHARQLDQESEDRKAGRDAFIGPTTPDEDLFNKVNANAGIKIVPDAEDVQRDWDNIVEITDESLNEMQQNFTGVAETMSEVLDETGKNAALSVGAVIAASGELFGQLLTQMGNVANALGATIVITTLEALKAIIRAYGEAEIAKATIGSFLSFGATLAAIGPIAAAMAAGLGVLSAIEGSFAKKNVHGSREQGGTITSTGPWFMHEGEVVINPRKNSPQEVASHLEKAGATGLVREALAGSGGVGGSSGRGGDFNASVRIYGNVNKQVDMDEALARFAGLINPVLA